MERTYWEAQAREKYWVQYGTKYGLDWTLIQHILRWRNIARNREARNNEKS